MGDAVVTMSLKLRNALASAGSAFFGALVGISFAGAFPEGLWAAGIAAGVAFFAAYGGNGNATRPSGTS